MLEFVKIILAKNIWSVVASWSILVQIFLAIKWHQYLLFYLHTCPFYLPATPHKHNSSLNSNPRRCAAVAGAQPAATAREANEGLTLADGKETKALRLPQWRRWRHGPVPRRGVRGRERHSPRRTGRASTRVGRRTASSAPPMMATIPGLVAQGGWPPLAPTGSSYAGLTPPTRSRPRWR
jgi:hypothetical protein